MFIYICANICKNVGKKPRHENAITFLSGRIPSLNWAGFVKDLRYFVCTGKRLTP